MSTRRKENPRWKKGGCVVLKVCVVSDDWQIVDKLHCLLLHDIQQFSQQKRTLSAATEPVVRAVTQQFLLSLGIVWKLLATSNLMTAGESVAEDQCLWRCAQPPL